MICVQLVSHLLGLLGLPFLLCKACLRVYLLLITAPPANTTCLEAVEPCTLAFEYKQDVAATVATISQHLRANFCLRPEPQ